MVAKPSFETPLLRVSRPVSACSRCRSAKIKCDGKLPACTACERNGRIRECSSANDQFAKGKERSYVASLESRVERLEKQIEQAKARKSSVVLFDPYLTPPTSKAQELPTKRIGTGKQSQRKEASDVDDLVADFGFLSVNATARDFYGFTAEMSFARLVLSTSSKEAMPRFATNVLPPRYAATPLVQHYLDYIFVLYPFLSETALFASLDNLYQDAGRHATPMDHWTIRMVLAVALASQSRYSGDSQYRDAVRHAAAALTWVDHVLQPGSRVAIQALLLLVQYAMLDPYHFSSWYLIGVASRVMLDLGLHQDPPEELRMKEVHLTLRRRIYSCVYALDRAISIVHRRAFSFTDDSANVPSCAETSVPLSIAARSRDQLFLRPMDTAPQLIKLRQIQSSCYQELFQSGRQPSESSWRSVWTTLSDLHEWYQRLPAGMQEPVKVAFKSEMLFSSILILSPSEKIHSVPDYAEALIFEYAVDYASSILSVCGGTEKCTISTYLDALRTSYVGRRLLDVLQSKQCRILDAGTPSSPLVPSGTLLPPPLPYRCSDEKVDRARTGIEQLTGVLDYLGKRFGYSALSEDFRVEATTLGMVFSAGNLGSGSGSGSLDGADSRLLYGHTDSAF